MTLHAYELIRACEARLKFVQDKLRIEVSAEEVEERIVRLKASVWKADIIAKVAPAANAGVAKAPPNKVRPTKTAAKKKKLSALEACRCPHRNGGSKGHFETAP